MKKIELLHGDCLKQEFLLSSGFQFKKNTNRIDEILKVQYSHTKRRNKKFSKDCISFDEFKSIVLSDCAYCGARPYKNLADRSCETKSKKLISKTTVFANGIDRINNKLGYVIDNCAPCCKICNSAKGELSIEDFREWAKNLNRNFIGIEKDLTYYDIATKRIYELHY